MSHIVIRSILAASAGVFLETKYAPELGLHVVGTGGLPKAFGATPMVLTCMSFWVLMHGFMVVGGARSKYSELAVKDGEKDVPERYAYPNLYAQGTSKHAKAFNCVQRSHQHIFETFPQLCLLSMVGAVHYPIAAALGALTYSVGRIVLSTSYAGAEGDAAKRYESALAPLMWYGFIFSVVVAMASSVTFLL